METQDDKVRPFLRDNIDKSPEKVALLKSPFNHISAAELALQLKCLQKAKQKIPLFFDNEKVKYPSVLALEQSSGQLAANYKSYIIQKNIIQKKLSADLTGGLGVDSFFISKNFDKHIYFETQKNLADLAAHNFSALHSENIEIQNFDGVENCPEKCDLIFIDPARRDKNGKKVFMLNDLAPDLTKSYKNLLNKTKFLLVKLSPMLDLKQALRTLEFTTQIHIVSVKSEVKELLFLSENTKEKSKEIKIFAVDISSENNYQIFEGSFDTNCEIELSNPKKYIYLPSNSVVKANLADCQASSMSLHKIARRTTLYTSDDFKSDYQGKIFEFIQEIKVDKKELFKHLPNLKANILTKNFPISTDELRKKLAIKDGGDIFIFAIKTKDDKNKLLITQKAF